MAEGEEFYLVMVDDTHNGWHDSYERIYIDEKGVLIVDFWVNKGFPEEAPLGNPSFQTYMSTMVKRGYRIDYAKSKFPSAFSDWIKAMEVIETL